MWVQLFQIDPCKNWYLHFCKTYDHQIWQAGTSTGFNWNETNQTRAGDIIMSRSHDKLKTSTTRVPWQDGDLLRCAPVYKVKGSSLWSHGLVRSCNKLKPLYLQYHNANGHQTWQDGNLPWQAPTHKVAWPFDHEVLKDY